MKLYHVVRFIKSFGKGDLEGSTTRSSLLLILFHYCYYKVYLVFPHLNVSMLSYAIISFNTCSYVM